MENITTQYTTGHTNEKTKLPNPGRCESRQSSTPFNMVLKEIVVVTTTCRQPETSPTHIVSSEFGKALNTRLRDRRPLCAGLHGLRYFLSEAGGIVRQNTVSLLRSMHTSLQVASFFLPLGISYTSCLESDCTSGQPCTSSRPAERQDHPRSGQSERLLTGAKTAHSGLTSD